MEITRFTFTSTTAYRKATCYIIKEILRGIVPAITADVFLRNIPAKRQTEVITQTNNSKCFQVEITDSEQYRNSFFIKKKNLASKTQNVTANSRTSKNYILKYLF